MKGGNLTVSNLLILAVGLIFLFIYKRPDAVIWVIIASGVMFVVPALINALVLSHEARKSLKGLDAMSSSKRSLGWIASIGAIMLGAVMILKPEIFHALYVYLFAAVLFLGGLHHIFVLAKAMRPVQPPVWLYAFPVALIVGGVAMFLMKVFHQVENQDLLLLAMGIGLIVYAVSSFLQLICYAALKKKYLPHSNQEPISDDEMSLSDHKDLP